MRFAAGFISFLLTIILPGIPLTKFGAKKGAWAVVTGATAGIGLEFSLQLARAGFNVFLVSRDLAKLHSVAANIEQSNPKIKTKIHAIDLANATDTQYNSLGADLDGLEIGVLINNAGMGHSYPEYFHLMPESETNSMLAVNICSLVRITHMVLPGMVQRHRGLILNLGSFSGHAPTPFLSVYTGTKGFLHSFSQGLGNELQGSGVEVRNLNTYFVVSTLSKIRRSSLLIPTPKSYVRSVLGHIGQSIGPMPYTSTPHPSHALVQYVIDRVGSWQFWFWINRRMQKSTRAKALKKKERLAKGQ